MSVRTRAESLDTKSIQCVRTLPHTTSTRLKRGLPSPMQPSYYSVLQTVITNLSQIRVAYKDTAVS